MQPAPVGYAVRACLWLALVLPAFASAAPAALTLDEAMRLKLGDENTAVDAIVEFGSLRFRIDRLTSDGKIELVGMAILPEPGEEGGSNPDLPS